MGSALHRSPEEASGGTIDVDGRCCWGSGPRSPGCAEGTGGTRRNTRLLPTSNGWAAISCSRPDDPALYGALISGDIDAADPWPPIKNWVTAHTGAELDERAELLGLAAHSVSSSAHEVSRLVACAPHTSTGVGEPWVRGLHQPVEVRACEPRNLASRQCPITTGCTAFTEGLRVVDFSALWAGPLCAHLLGLGVRRSSRWRRRPGPTALAAATRTSTTCCTVVIAASCSTLPTIRTVGAWRSWWRRRIS